MAVGVLVRTAATDSPSRLCCLEHTFLRTRRATIRVFYGKPAGSPGQVALASPFRSRRRGVAEGPLWVADAISVLGESESRRGGRVLQGPSGRGGPGFAVQQQHASVSDDVGLFTGQGDPQRFDAAVNAVRDACTADGPTVEVTQRSGDSFVCSLTCWGGSRSTDRHRVTSTLRGSLVGPMRRDG